jgi:hypothetical protein
MYLMKTNQVWFVIEILSIIQYYHIAFIKKLNTTLITVNEYVCIIEWSTKKKEGKLDLWIKKQFCFVFNDISYKTITKFIYRYVYVTLRISLNACTSFLDERCYIKNSSHLFVFMKELTRCVKVFVLNSEEILFCILLWSFQNFEI